MLKSWFTDLFRLRVLTGVDVQLLADGQMLINFCSMKIKGDQLSVTDKGEGLKNILHFSKQLKSGLVVLNLSGKGVLTKRMERIEKLDQQVINQILPNANAGDFYFQLAHEEGGSVVSLIRRKDADELMAGFSAKGFKVIALILNGFTENAAYQSAFQVLVTGELVEAKSPALTRRMQEAFAKARLTGIAAVSGTALLVLLLVNFFVYTNYADLLRDCAVRSNTSAAEISKYQSLETEVVGKTRFVKNVGWTGGLSPAFMVDQLLAGMPVPIKLNEFAINQQDQRISGSTAEALTVSKTIKISGSCSEASVLNNWLFGIRSNKWVGSCRIDNYQINNEDGRALFSITINLKDDEG